MQFCIKKFEIHDCRPLIEVEENRNFENCFSEKLKFGNWKFLSNFEKLRLNIWQGRWAQKNVNVNFSKNKKKINK